jgi:hypothetical protein
MSDYLFFAFYFFCFFYNKQYGEICLQLFFYFLILCCREFMENFAKERNMDPLLPETWYKFSYRDFRHVKVFLIILKKIIITTKNWHLKKLIHFVPFFCFFYILKGGRALLQKFKGYFNALKNLFPDVKVDPRFFPKISTDLFFVPFFSFSFPIFAFLSFPFLFLPFPSFSFLFFSFLFSFAFLIHAFLIYFLTQFLVWNHIENRRGFFEKYAKNNGFDPHIPEMWYLQPVGKIMEEKVLNKKKQKQTKTKQNKNKTKTKRKNTKKYKKIQKKKKKLMAPIPTPQKCGTYNP